MRMLAVATLALVVASPASATVTISFSGTSGGHSVVGSVRFDETASPSSVNTAPGYTVAQYFPSSAAGYVFSFLSDGVSGTSGYRGSVLDAQPGSGFNDFFGAFVVAGGSGVQQYGFTVDYLNATALTSTAIPASPPQGPATFSYSFAGTGYSIPVTWSVQAVPEPASWALLIAGFGVVGGTLRVRPGRRATA